MRIFCPATLLLPSLLLRPVSGPGAPSAPIGPPVIGPIVRRGGYCAAVYLSWSTGPRGRACHPYAASSAAKIGRVPRMGPDAPGWALVVCPSRRKPGARQPEQYALDHGFGQISGKHREQGFRGPQAPADSILDALALCCAR